MFNPKLKIILDKRRNILLIYFFSHLLLIKIRKKVKELHIFILPVCILFNICTSTNTQLRVLK